MQRNTWIAIYVIILLADIFATNSGYSEFEFFLKPLLMPLLAIHFLIETRLFISNLKTWVILALFFSWTGDILLMFQGKNQIFFLLGLSAFLLAQICYIIFFHFLRLREYIKGNVWLLVGVLVYYGLLMSVLSPHLGSMKIPVSVYGVVISFMLMLALHMIFSKNKRSAQLLIGGAVFFITSDSLLAMNKFYSPFNAAGVLIMLTYGLAQMLLILGAVRYITTQKTV